MTSMVIPNLYSYGYSLKTRFYIDDSYSCYEGTEINTNDTLLCIEFFQNCTDRLPLFELTEEISKFLNNEIKLFDKFTINDFIYLIYKASLPNLSEQNYQLIEEETQKGKKLIRYKGIDLETKQKIVCFQADRQDINELEEITIVKNLLSITKSIKSIDRFIINDFKYLIYLKKDINISRILPTFECIFSILLMLFLSVNFRVFQDINSLLNYLFDIDLKFLVDVFRFLFYKTITRKLFFLIDYNQKNYSKNHRMSKKEHQALIKTSFIQLFLIIIIFIIISRLRSITQISFN